MPDAQPAEPITSASIDPEATYSVDLARPATVGAVRLLPRGDLTLRGDLLVQLITENGADAVLAAQPR